MKNLKGRVAIVTGAASGIGRGTALALARRGVNVIVADINGAGSKAVAAEIAGEGGHAFPMMADLSQAETMPAIRNVITGMYGQVDIVMNNVGVLASGLPQDIPLAEWERIINLNLMSVIRSVHEFIPYMVERGSGHIVNTASFAGLFPYAYDRLPYAATKAAIVTLSEGLALYLKPRGVGITCLCPGPVKTAIGATMTKWTEGIGLRGPGAQFQSLDPADVGEMVADAIEADQVFLPTDAQVLTMMQRRAADPNAFIEAQLEGFAEG